MQCTHMSIHKTKVDYIFESLDSIPFRLREIFWKWSYASKCPKLSISEHDLKVLEQKDETFLEKFEVC